MKQGGIRLAAILFLGLLSILIGVTGKLGSVLGAIIDPANMQDTTQANEDAAKGLKGEGVAPEVVKAYIKQVFGPYADAAIKIAQAESNFDVTNKNSQSVGGSHAEGVFQILVPSTWNTTAQKANNPYDYKANTLAAYEIFQRDGYSWREWSTAPGLGLK